MAMHLSMESKQGVAVITLEGALTTGNPMERLDAAIDGLLKGGQHNILVDMRLVTSLDFRGVDMPILSKMEAYEVLGKLKFLILPGEIENALVMSPLWDFMDIFYSLDEALDSFRTR